MRLLWALILHKKQWPPKRFKKGAELPTKCPECGCQDVILFSQTEEPDEVPEVGELPQKIDLDDDDFDLIDPDDLL